MYFSRKQCVKKNLVSSVSASRDCVCYTPPPCDMTLCDASWPLPPEASRILWTAPYLRPATE